MTLKRLLYISAFATPAMIAVMMWHGAPLKVPGISPRGIIDMELACTPFRAAQLYNAWQPLLIERAITNTYIDFIFILCYGTLLCCLCLLVSSYFGALWRRAGKWLAVGMLVAAFFDVVENILMLKILRGSMGPELVASTYMFAFVKFALVITGILYIIASWLAILLKPKPVLHA